MTPAVSIQVHSEVRDTLPRNSNVVTRVRMVLTIHVPELRNFDLALLLVQVDARLSEVFDNLFERENVQPSHRVGIRIEFEGDNQPFFKLVRFSKNPVAHLFEAISRLLQSHRELLLRKWNVEVLLIPCPEGGSTLREIPWSFEVAAKKKSTIIIDNRDGLCLWRALVVAFAVDQSKRIANIGQVSHKEARKRYHKVARRGSRMQEQVLVGTVYERVLCLHHAFAEEPIILRGIPGILRCIIRN